VQSDFVNLLPENKDIALLYRGLFALLRDLHRVPGLAGRGR
jgi:hypothetical protein